MLHNITLHLTNNVTYILTFVWMITIISQSIKVEIFCYKGTVQIEEELCLGWMSGLVFIELWVLMGVCHPFSLVSSKSSSLSYIDNPINSTFS